MNTTSPISRRRFVAGGLAVAGGVVVGGCTSTSDAGNTTGAANAKTATLRFHARTQAPDSLDPARWPFWNPFAYDVLIYRGPEGKLQPRLATSWEYVGIGNKTFAIKLRPGVKFSDGTPLTSEAIRANIEYRRDPSVGNQSAQYLAAIKEVELVDDLTAVLHLSQPNPLLPGLFSQGQAGPGILISPAAIANPRTLATRTFGAGPYRLDPADTVAGDHYSYVPEPSYWNPSEARWKKVVVHYLPEEGAALAALQTGQLDAAMVTTSVLEAGKKAGLAATGPGLPIVLGFSLADRAGHVVPALGDLRVRQALNYAIDRVKITKAVIGESGRATDQLSAPGHAGWNDAGFYPYDQAKAKALLAQAGYGNGFTLPVRIPRSDQHIRVTQAVADDLSKVGVQVTITAVAGNQFDQANDATNRAYGAVYLGWGIDPPVRMGSSFWLPDATNNTFDSVDGTLVKLHKQALVADPGSGAEIDRQIIARVAELAWFLPVLLMGELLLYKKDAVSAPWTDFQSDPTSAAIELRPAGR